MGKRFHAPADTSPCGIVPVLRSTLRSFIARLTEKADMNESALRARIRRLNETGEIPCDEVPDRLWAGPGTGDTCAACTERIATDETEFEVDLSSGSTLRLHRRCYTLWLDECGALDGKA
jgi:hypothetical protein